MTSKTVSLVLGSGGARGLAHIGVIQYIEERNYQIKSIAGCSMGALIGGIYALGKLDEYEQWVRAITKFDIISLLDISLQKGGLVKGEKIIETLRELVGDKSIEDLPIAYTAVASDLVNEKEVWIDDGPLFDAIRASISMPLFFTPFMRHGIELVDGGVLNPLPIAPTFRDDTDITIAVNLDGAAQPKEKKHKAKKKKKDKEKEKTVLSPLREKIDQFVDKLTSGTTDSVKAGLGMYDVVHQSFDAMQGAITRQKLAAYPPGKVIEIARDACGVLEFDRADEMIALGYEKAKESIP
jgi:NTE family protein